MDSGPRTIDDGQLHHLHHILKPIATEVKHGSQVWIPDEKEMWKIATVIAVQGEGADAIYEVDAVSSSVKSPKAYTHAQIVPVDPSHLVDMNNMCLMNNMHEAPLLDLLHRRFSAKKIYTYTSDILISLNPFELIPGLYESPSRYYHIDDSIRGYFGVEDEDVNAALAPHVYQIANNALKALCNGRQGGDFLDQSVIISGESGAGKTENSKYVLGYLIEANNILSASASSAEETSFAEYLKDVLVQSSVVLEAFGNAKTLRNDNSSRFGKYIKLLYESEISHSDGRPYPRLVSAMTETFLLEKSRLTSVGKGERCYHIFYQLVSALEDISLREELGLHHGVESFRMLAQGECLATSEDASEFNLTLNALKKLQFSEASVCGIIRLLATCLHLGNLDFVSDPNKNDMVTITSPTSTLESIAENLGLDTPLLRTALITQKLIVRGRSSLKVKILSVDEVANNANALLKWLYSRLFDWIVKEINLSYNAFHKDANAKHFVGILDIFGFEILRTNSFEQLCINYTNERLQQQFNQHVFVSEQEMYRLEGLEWESVTFQDNQPVIDLISSTKKPLGLLQLLEEQGMLNRKPDDNALLFSFNQHHEIKDAKARNNAIFSKSKFGNNAFVIKHFAGDVTYTVDGFLIKNNDALQDDLLNTLKLSQNVFIREVLGFPALIPEKPSVVEGEDEVDNGEGEEDAAESPTTNNTTSQPLSPPPQQKQDPANSAAGKKMASASTVSLHFRTQLDMLMNTLYSTSPHYIKCIKSNNKKQAGEFEASLINQQLRYSGVLEVVRIRREGFPVQMSYKEFFHKYRILLKGASSKAYFVDINALDIDQCKQYCVEIVSIAGTSYEVQIGNSMVFLRDQGRDAMQQSIHRYFEKKATIIQSKYKSILLRRLFIVQRSKIQILKRFLRMSVPRKKYLIQLKAICKIQRFYFYRIRRKRILHNFRVMFAVMRIQSNFRRSVVQKRFKWILHRLISFQTLYRSYSARKNYVMKKYAAVYLQTSLRKYLHAVRFSKMKRATIKIQSMFRKFVSQKAFRITCWAVSRLQSKIRQYLSKKRFNKTLHHIVLVQSFVRCFLSRFHFVRAKACATMIQTNVRRFQAHKMFMIMKGTTIGLQTWYRCYSQRHKFLLLKRQCILLTSIIRRFLARAKFNRQRRALVRLQRAVVAFLRNMRLRRRLQALHDPQNVSPEKLRQYLAISPADVAHLHKCEESGQSKPVLRRLIHSVLLAPTDSKSTATVIKDILHTTCKDLVDVDSLGRNSFHYVTMNPSLEVIKMMASILNSYEFESSDAMEGLDEDEADAVDNARITRIKNTVAESIQNTKLLEGWLKKKRGGFMWQRRWVVLSEDYIVYYNSNTVSAKDPKFAIPLEGCTVQRLPGSREPIFEIFAPNMGVKRTFFGSSSKKSMTFLCENEEDLQRWLIPLRAMSGVDTLRSTLVSYVKWELRHLLLASEDKQGNTPLHTLLLSSSATTMTAPDENVPLNHCKVLVWLIENGSPISAQNKDGNTPLHIALLNQVHPLLVKSLLIKGADTKAKRNLEGVTVLELYRRESIYRDLYGDYFGEYAGSKPADSVLTMKGYSYFSIYFGSQTFEKAQASIGDHPVLTISAFNSKRQLIEAPKEFKEATYVDTISSEKNIYWGSMWHMNTPLENLQEGSFVLVEYRLRLDGPTVSSVQISLDRQTVDSNDTRLHLSVPTDGSRQANPILAMKENASLEVEILLTRKPRNISIQQLSK